MFGADMSKIGNFFFLANLFWIEVAAKKQSGLELNQMPVTLKIISVHPSFHWRYDIEQNGMKPNDCEE
jgi:hypothetical protein